MSALEPKKTKFFVFWYPNDDAGDEDDPGDPLWVTCDSMADAEGVVNQLAQQDIHAVCYPVAMMMADLITRLEEVTGREP